MDLASFSSFKYPHPGRGVMSPARKRFAGITLVLALVAAVLAFPVGLAALLLPLVAWFGVPKKLYLGPRYLLCGPSIIYFANVARLELDEAAGVLTLHSRSGKRFVLERDKFPTGARKAAKITANRAAKFDKVCARLIDKVLRHAEDVELQGISRSRVKAADREGAA